MSIQSFRIATPCSARWSTMRGDERVRFCDACRKNVYDFSQMTLDEIEDLLQRTEGKICARLWQRADGKVLTADCKIGKRRRRIRLLGALASAASVLFSFFGAAAIREAAVFEATTGALAVDVQPPSPRSRALEPKNLRDFGQNNQP